jgi:hypothetical protein
MDGRQEIEPKVAQTSANANRESNPKRKGKRVWAPGTEDVERREKKTRVFRPPAINWEATRHAVAVEKRIQPGRTRRETSGRPGDMLNFKEGAWKMWGEGMWRCQKWGYCRRGHEFMFPQGKMTCDMTSPTGNLQGFPITPVKSDRQTKLAEISGKSRSSDSRISQTWLRRTLRTLRRAISFVTRILARNAHAVAIDALPMRNPLLE